MEALKETSTHRPKIHHTEQQIHEIALKICDRYADGINSLEVLCHANKITDRTFRRWINKYPKVKEYYDEAMTNIKYTRSEKNGILAMSAQEKLLRGPVITTDYIEDTFDKDWNLTGHIKRTISKQLPPHAPTVKFVMSNYDKTHAQLQPWGEDKHAPKSGRSREEQPSVLRQDAEALKELQDYKEFCKWKENNNLDNVRNVRPSPIINKNPDNFPDITSAIQSTTTNLDIENNQTNEEKPNVEAAPHRNAQTWKQSGSQSGEEFANIQGKGIADSNETEIQPVEQEGLTPTGNSILMQQDHQTEEIEFDTDEDYWNKYWSWAAEERRLSWQQEEENHNVNPKLPDDWNNGQEYPARRRNEH